MTMIVRCGTVALCVAYAVQLSTAQYSAVHDHLETRNPGHTRRRLPAGCQSPVTSRQLPILMREAGDPATVAKLAHCQAERLGQLCLSNHFS